MQQNFDSFVQTNVEYHNHFNLNYKGSEVFFLVLRQ